MRHRAIVLSVLVGAAAAASLLDPPPAHPIVVSGRAQPKVSNSGAQERWFKSDVTITIDASLADLGKGAPDAVRESFGTWLGTDVKLPKLRFDDNGRKALTLTPDGENRIYYAPITLAGHENDLAITLAYARPDTGEVTEADIVINSRQPFGMLQAAAPKADDGASKGSATSGNSGEGEGHSSSALSVTAVPSCKSTFDLQSVVTHEIGHFFGLGEDLTDASATMYYSTAPCDLGKRDLKSTDSTEMLGLYANAEPASGDNDSAPSAAAHCSMAAMPAHASPTSAPLWLSALAVFGLALRSRRKT